jgi:hypothetical protein
MNSRHLPLAILGVLACAVLSAAAVTPSHAESGLWSMGGNFGIGIYSNSHLNDDFKLIGIKEINSGIEFGGSLRYGAGPKVGIEIEANRMRGSSSTPDPGFPDVKWHTQAIALPVNVVVTAAQNDQYDFNLFGGVGPIFSTKYGVEQGTISIESESKTGFTFQGGLEGDYKVSPQVALTARALGRYAKASNIALTVPSVGTTIYDVDFNGAAFSLGLRVFFGGEK